MKKRGVSVTAATCTSLPNLQAVANYGLADFFREKNEKSVEVESPSGVL